METNPEYTSLVLICNSIIFGFLSIFAAIQFHKYRNFIYQKLTFLWLSMLITFPIQVVLIKNNFFIALGFATVFIGDYVIADVGAHIGSYRWPKKTSLGLLTGSIFVSWILYAGDFAFYWISFPIVLAVTYPLVVTGIRGISGRWNTITHSEKIFYGLTIFLSFHQIDFIFLRQLPGFAPYGYTIAVASLLGISFFAYIAIKEKDDKPLKPFSGDIQSHPKIQSAHLTPRETEVMHQMLDGKSNTEISEALFITVNTVKKHVNKVLEKTDSKNRQMLHNQLFGRSSAESHTD